MFFMASLPTVLTANVPTSTAASSKLSFPIAISTICSMPYLTTMILLLETLFFAEFTVKLPIFLAVCVVNLLVNTTSDSIFSPARCILPFSESPLLTSVITAKSLCSPFEAFNDFGNILKFASQFAISRISSSERKGFLFVFS